MSRIDYTEEQKEMKEAKTKREPSGNYTDYVVGFLFDRKRKLVVLIEKKRPEWQIGFLNGVGGHVEFSETPAEAMEREFEEETGLRILGWDHTITLIVAEDNERVFFFKAKWTHGEVKTVTDEKIIIANYNQLPENTLESVMWAIPLSLDLRFMRPIEFFFYRN